MGAIEARIAAFEAEMALLEIKGGPGSGNWGHAGRKGKRGGSAPKSGRGAAMSLRTGKDAAARQAAAKGGKGGGGGVEAAQQRVDKIRKTLAGLKEEGAKWGYDPEFMNDKDFEFWAKRDFTGKPDMLAAQDFVARVKAAKQDLADASTELNKAKLAARPKPAAGAPPSGEAVNNEKAKKFLAAGVGDNEGTLYAEANKDLQRVLSATQAERADHKIAIANNLAERSGLPPEKVNQMVKTWAETSADSMREALEMQVAVARFLGREPDEFVKKRLAEVEKLNDDYRNKDRHTNEERDRFVMAMYEHTQEQLAAAGFNPDDTIRLHRGVQSVFKNTDVNDGDVVTLNQNPATSWSLSMNVAKSFAMGDQVGGNIGNYRKTHGGSAVLTMDVPVSSIIGTCRTGIGCLIEAELVVGDTGNHQAVVRDKSKISWDYQD